MQLGRLVFARPQKIAGGILWDLGFFLVVNKEPQRFSKGK